MRLSSYFLALLLVSGIASHFGRVHATLLAPVVTFARSNSGQVEIGWTSVEGATRYEVQVRAGEFGAWQSVAFVGATHSSAKVTGLLLYGESFARVRASTLSESSEFSAPFSFPLNSALRPPPVPANLRAINISWKEITIGWDAAERAGGYAVGFRDASSAIASYSEIWGVGQTTLTELSLKPETDYFFMVLARGNGTGDSAVSAELKVTTLRQPPAAATVNFLGAATNFGGNWPEHFGAEGYALTGGSRWLPENLSIVFEPGEYTWETGTTRPSALLQDPGRTNRVAGAFDFFLTSSVHISAEQPRQVSFYFLDWKREGRSEELHFIDEASDRIVAQTPISGFQEGLYVTYMIKGRVRIEFRSADAPSIWYGSPLLAGVFFGGPVQTAQPTLSLRSAGSLFSLKITAPAGREYLIEKSTDLRTWLPRSSGHLDTPEANVTLNVTEAASEAFFRVKLE